MGFWHTGYAEFHEATGLDEYAFGPPRPVRYACAHCSMDFDELETLRRHRFEQHPLRQPMPLVRGRPVGELPMQLMTPLRAADVVVEDVAECRANGQTVALTALGLHLQKMRREYVDLELINTGMTGYRVLDFRIAEEEHLIGVEAAFTRMTRGHALSLSAVSQFTKDCRVFVSAMPYCDGICHYLYGVMAKEHSRDSGPRPDQYTERYLRATEAFAAFKRPLSRSIRALVAFHFDHFRDAAFLASEGSVRCASQAFAALLEGLPWHSDAAYSHGNNGAIEDQLTDQDTLQILEDAM